MPLVNLPCAAVDVGYFSTKYTLEARGSEIHCASFPSVAPRAGGSETSSFASIGSGLNVVRVKAGDHEFYVGPEAMLRKSGRTPRVVLESFASRPEYLALLHGALYQIAKFHLGGKNEPHTLEISDLVLGLPLNTLRQFSDRLKEIATGTHELPSLVRGGKPLTVTVKRTTVIAQPHGTVIYNMVSRKMAEGQHWLVLDLGGGTFDWFVTFGHKVLTDMCGAHPRGMLAAANAVADAIKTGMRDDPIMIDRIDTAIRTGASHINMLGGPHPMEQYKPLVEGVIGECIDKMFDSIESLNSIDTIVATGGGAKILAQQLAKRAPEAKGSILIDDEPIYSNVRGFFLVGQQLGQSRAKVSA